MALQFSRYSWVPSTVTRSEGGRQDEQDMEMKAVAPPSLIVNDPSKEAAADAMAVASQQVSSADLPSFIAQRTGTNAGGIHLHADEAAHDANISLRSRAFTRGNHIYFGMGQYQPGTKVGNMLLAHEMTHVAQQQQSGQTAIQKDSITMEPLNIRTGMPGNLDKLTGDNADTSGVSIAHGDTALIEQSSVSAETLLPWTSANAWNSEEIAGTLGQYDRIPGTDSDALRCVQTVGLMSHVIMGPAAVSQYLSSMSLQGMLANQSARGNTALAVIDFVQGQVGSGKATYGHLYWVIEAIHDLFYKDDTGTPEGEIRGQVIPGFDMSAGMTNMDTWCKNPSELMAEANKLNKGEQLMLNTWSVSFNSTFDVALGEKGATTNRLTYNVVNDKGKFVRSSTINRIDTKTKPDPTKKNKDRDSISGHQMLIYKDAATGEVKMYEPELAAGGAHLFNLTKDSSVLQGMLFHDQPAFELYNYVQLLGKITPVTSLKGFGGQIK
ncbi:hypothetical protein BH10BAC3_BH10BAC3_42850 [soil metagenome]